MVRLQPHLEWRACVRHLRFKQSFQCMGAAGKWFIVVRAEAPRLTRRKVVVFGNLRVPISTYFSRACVWESCFYGAPAARHYFLLALAVSLFVHLRLMWLAGRLDSHKGHAALIFVVFIAPEFLCFLGEAAAGALRVRETGSTIGTTGLRPSPDANDRGGPRCNRGSARY